MSLSVFSITTSVNAQLFSAFTVAVSPAFTPNVAIFLAFLVSLDGIVGIPSIEFKSYISLSLSGNPVSYTVYSPVGTFSIFILPFSSVLNDSTLSKALSSLLNEIFSPSFTNHPFPFAYILNSTSFRLIVLFSI